MTVSKATTIEATYRIVTPMFCSGADQNLAELRLPSFKGALRFWWRSLMWQRVPDVQSLQRKEAALFGASDQNVGQSIVQLRISKLALEPQTGAGQILEGGRLLGLHYLGYGIMEAFDGKNTKAGRLTRSMLPGGQFTVACRFSRLAEPDQIEEVRRALVLLGTVGGLGSKSRKGFGSLTLTSLAMNDEQQELPHSIQERLSSVLYELRDGLPDWTAWTSSSRVVVTTHQPKSRAVEALDALGREEVHFRSWGRNGTVLKQPSEQNFQIDHDLSKGLTTKSEYPFRVAFGLPHNYGKGTQNEVAPENGDRRASPLFLHVHHPNNDVTPSGVAVFLPAGFLPVREQVRAFGRSANLGATESFWFPVHAFLDRLDSDGTRPKSRPGYEHFPDGSGWWQKKTTLIGKEVSLG